MFSGLVTFETELAIVGGEEQTSSAIRNKQNKKQSENADIFT